MPQIWFGETFFKFLKKSVDDFLRFGNITNADGDRRATNCRRERGGNRRKSAQVEKRSGEPAPIAVRYPPRVKGYHLRSQTESRSGRLRGSNKKDRGRPLFFFARAKYPHRIYRYLRAILPAQPQNPLSAFLRKSENTPKR